MKRGDLSMGVVIGAAIALLILVVLSVLIFRALSNVTEGTSCDSIEGSMCIPEDEECSDTLDAVTGNPLTRHSADCGEGSICCIPVG